MKKYKREVSEMGMNRPAKRLRLDKDEELEQALPLVQAKKRRWIFYFRSNLPEKSLAAHFEKSADGRKTQKERVAISACLNATGSIKLPLLLIGKSKNRCCFKNIPLDSLPVRYASQSNAGSTARFF